MSRLEGLAGTVDLGGEGVPVESVDESGVLG
jgi:hypothetical protein